jgi:hypothetical protein
MPSNSNVLYSQQYQSATELAAQQLQPRFTGLFVGMTAVGQTATVANFIDVGEAELRSELYTPMVPSDVVHSRPWVYPINCDKMVLFDTIEQMQMNANPQSEYVRGIVSAINRKMDDEALRAFFANRNVGQNGTVSEAFGTFNGNATTRVISVDVGGTASGMNVEKVQALLESMRSTEVGLDQDETINIAISPKQERNLMNEIEIVSSDFTMKRIMDSGTMAGSGYLNVNWVLTNKYLVDGNGYERVPAWTQRGMSFCTWSGGMATAVSQREDLRGRPWQAYGQGHYGSVRRDEKRVFEIKASRV